MSGLQLKYLTAAENEFLAEETIVTIVPKFSHPVLHFISVSIIFSRETKVKHNFVIVFNLLSTRESMVHLMTILKLMVINNPMKLNFIYVP